MGESESGAEAWEGKGDPGRVGWEYEMVVMGKGRGGGGGGGEGGGGGGGEGGVM